MENQCFRDSMGIGAGGLGAYGGVGLAMREVG